MKKIITLVMVLALLLTSVVAIAETKGTPNINTFATMKTKYNEKAGVITITLSKPVDRLLVVWTGKGEEPEELAVDENLQATALTWGHKYMPGTKQSYVVGPADYLGFTDTIMYVEGFDLETSEVIYDDYTDFLLFPYDNDVCDDDGPYGYFDNFATLEVPVELCLDEDGNYDSDLFVDMLADFMIYFGETSHITYQEPYIDIDGDLVDGWIRYTDPCGTYVANHHYYTVKATPADTAYMTQQGDWAVYYNRAGKIVGIELFEGQF